RAFLPIVPGQNGGAGCCFCARGHCSIVDRSAGVPARRGRQRYTVSIFWPRAEGLPDTKVAERSRTLATALSGGGLAEQDPREWWAAAFDVLRGLATTPGIDPAAIVALSYACTSCTLVALDQQGLPRRLGNSVLPGVSL